MGLATGADGASPRWGRVAAEGCTSTGATMSVAHRAPAAATASGGHRCSCGGGGECVVNIYVNNNVQGVTNSVLFGSKVVMRDPGARVTSRRPRRGGRRGTNKTAPVKTGIILLVAAAFCLILFFVCYYVRRLN